MIISVRKHLKDDSNLSYTFSIYSTDGENEFIQSLFLKAEFKEIGKFVNIGLKDSFTNILNV